MTALAAIGTLALAGVPPLGGAWTKEAVIAAAGHEQKIVAVACMVAGGLSAAYALRLHLLAYGFTAAPGEGAQPAPAAYAAMAGLASFSLVLSILWLPGAHEAVTKFLGTEIPKPTTLATVSSPAAVGLGQLGRAAWRERVCQSG